MASNAIEKHKEIKTNNILDNNVPNLSNSSSLNVMIREILRFTRVLKQFKEKGYFILS